MEPKLKRILLEFLVYTIGFFGSITLLPLCTFYYEGVQIPMISKPQYLDDFRIGYVYVVLFVMILISFFTLKKAVIIITNSVSILAGLFSLFVILMSFAWWGGSPYHPDFGYGIILSLLFMLLLIIRTFYLTSSLIQLKISRPVQVSIYLVAGLIPVGVIIFTAVLYVRISKAPVFDIGMGSTIRNRHVYSESWKYEKAYGAKIIKYSSRDTLEREAYRMDSVQFIFFDDNSNVRKRFTKRGALSTARIEKILEANDD